MQIKIARAAARPATGTADDQRDMHAGPVVVLETDHDAAGALQQRLTEYGFDWIAMFQDLAEARRMLAAAPVSLVVLSIDRRAPEVLAMARELELAAIPLILTSATGRPLVFPGLSGSAPVVARGCPREMLFAAFDAIRLHHRPPPA